MAAGTIDGQMITIINEGAGSITFAASGSNVANSANATILGNTAETFIWSTRTALWYSSTPAGIPAMYFSQGGNSPYTIPNDGVYRILSGCSITFVVPAGMSGAVTVTASVEAIINTSNTAINANLSMYVGIDGVAQSPQYRLSGMNSGIGQGGSLSGVWNFTGLGAGSHTVAINVYWNGTANAAMANYGAISASVVNT
jgi:hypothetical protein